MHRPTLLALIIVGSFAAACSGTENQATPDGGTRDPDGGVPDGGVPQVTGECVDQGYPCSPSEESPEARALSDQYMAEVQTRMEAGESMEDIAAWLAAQDDVAHVIGDKSAIRFRVEGGAAMWAYDPDEGIHRPIPEVPAAQPSAATPSPSASVTVSPSVAPKAVLREGGSETKIKKKALIIEPFEEYIVTPSSYWKQQLRSLHDYDTVDHFRNRDVQDQHFGNWNDYRFIWVTTHGQHLPKDDPLYSALYSSHMCKEYGWLWHEIEDLGRGDETTELGGSLRGLFGRARSYIENQVTESQKIRWAEFEKAEAEEMKAAGTFCGTVKMDWLRVPGQEFDGNALTDLLVRYKGYGETWFENRYRGGLKDAFLYQRACTTDLLPLHIASGSHGAILGWDHTINSEADDKTIAVLFERLIRHGETVKDALDRVKAEGLDSHGQGDDKVNLKVVSNGVGGEENAARVREIVSIVDPIVGVPYPDEGAMLDAREITASGNTIVDVTVELVGFGKLDEGELEKYKIRFYNQAGRAISQEWDVDEPHEGRTFMTVPVSLNQEIRTPTEVEIEARITLPEGPGSLDSRHRIKLTVGPAIETLWYLNVGGGGTARGEFVFAPFPVAIMDGEGRTIWQVTLAQLDDAPVPTATILIVGHNGRTPECTGQTGNFEALVTVQFTVSTMPTEAYGGGLGEGECGDFVNVEIVSFSKTEDLVANVSGTICELRRVGDEVVVTPVPINGRFQMPAAGCGADPGGDVVGSYYASQEPSLCFDIYANAAIAPVFDQTCTMGGGLVCSEDPCSTSGQIGQCDYTDDAVQLSFRGQITHFYPGGDWPPIADLQTACELQLGTWTTGEPPMP